MSSLALYLHECFLDLGSAVGHHLFIDLFPDLGSAWEGIISSWIFFVSLAASFCRRCDVPCVSMWIFLVTSDQPRGLVSSWIFLVTSDQPCGIISSWIFLVASDQPTGIMSSPVSCLWRVLVSLVVLYLQVSFSWPLINLAASCLHRSRAAHDL
jgi:hypothetical protein